MSALKWKVGTRVVIESRRVPIDFVVAHFAVGWELRRSMRRIGGRVVIFQMAGHAGSGSTGKSLCVTLIACQTFMPTVQRKTGGRIVVEQTGFPGSFRVAGLTVGAKPSLSLIHI